MGRIKGSIIWSPRIRHKYVLYKYKKDVSTVIWVIWYNKQLVNSGNGSLNLLFWTCHLDNLSSFIKFAVNLETLRTKSYNWFVLCECTFINSVHIVQQKNVSIHVKLHSFGATRSFSKLCCCDQGILNGTLKQFQILPKYWLLFTYP